MPTRIPKAELKRDFEEVVEELGKVPTREEYNSIGEYSYSSLSKYFGSGSYVTAVNELGFDYTPDNSGFPDDVVPEKIGLSELKADHSRVTEQLGRVPSMSEYDYYGQFSAQTIGRRLGGNSYIQAMNNLGYDYEASDYHPSVSRKEVIEDIDRLREEEGHVPSREDYDGSGEYSVATVLKAFETDSWEEFLKLTGNYEDYTESIPPDYLRKDFLDVKEELGHLPSESEYQVEGSFGERGVSDLLYFFSEDSESWNEAVEAMLND